MARIKIKEEDIRMVDYHDNSIMLIVKNIKNIDYTKFKSQILSDYEIVNKLKKFYEEDKWMLTANRTNDDGSSGDWDEMGFLGKVKEILEEKK